MDYKINNNLLLEIEKIDGNVIDSKNIFLTLSNIQILYNSYVKNIGFTMGDFTNILIQQLHNIILIQYQLHKQVIKLQII